MKKNTCMWAVFFLIFCIILVTLISCAESFDNTNDPNSTVAIIYDSEYFEGRRITCKTEDIGERNPNISKKIPDSFIPRSIQVGNGIAVDIVFKDRKVLRFISLVPDMKVIKDIPPNVPIDSVIVYETKSKYSGLSNSMYIYVGYDDVARAWYNVLKKSWWPGSLFTLKSFGTGSDTYIKMNQKDTRSSINYLSDKFRLQDKSSVIINFEMRVLRQDNTMADALWFFMGGNEPASSPLNWDDGGWEFGAGVGYHVVFELYDYWGKGVLLTTGKCDNVNSPNILKRSRITDIHITNDWVPVTIVYKKGTTGTWGVSINGESLLIYDDAKNKDWIQQSGNFWGFGARTGGATSDCSIRKVQVTVMD